MKRFNLHYRSKELYVFRKQKDHSPVQVDKKEDEVFSETNKGGLHMCLEFAPVVDLGRVEVVGVGQWLLHELVDVPGDERCVQKEYDPVAGE